jgi:hypothetical protein
LRRKGGGKRRGRANDGAKARAGANTAAHHARGFRALVFAQHVNPLRKNINHNQSTSD